MRSTCLAKLPRTVVYLDAGAADALPVTRAAQLLREAGVAHAQGFFLNATHFDWTLHEIHYGWQISRLTGGKHFVVNTAENGRGPLVPRNRNKRGNEVLCNPRGPRTRAKADLHHRLPGCGRVRLDREPGQIRRDVPSRRTAGRVLLDRLRARARPQRGLHGPLRNVIDVL